MCKDSIYLAIKGCIARVCELPDDSLKGFSREVTDARHMLIHIMWRYGFSHNEIKRLTCISRQRQYVIIRDFDDRMKAGGMLFSYCYDKAVEEIKKTYPMKTP